MLNSYILLAISILAEAIASSFVVATKGFTISCTPKFTDCKWKTVDDVIGTDWNWEYGNHFLS